MCLFYRVEVWRWCEVGWFRLAVGCEVLRKVCYTYSISATIKVSDLMLAKTNPTHTTSAL